MKKVFLSLTVGLITLSSIAQVSFGPRVGVNLSKYGYDYKESSRETEVNYKFGQSIGAIMNLQITSFLAFQPNANISVKGVAHNVDSWNSGQSVNTGFARIRVTYFELPINLAIGIRLGSGQIQIFAGPYVAVAIVGRNVWDYEINTNGVREDKTGSEKIIFNKNAQLHDGDDWKVKYQNPFDYGVNFGLGFKYKHLLFNAGFAMGLANLQPDISGVEFDPKDRKYSNRTIFITAAWLFGGK
ncbi:MAG: PorT family protein [Bacteroidales bacterium]|nr:PorT family protein [Bacteroidales bacterium]